MTDDFDVQKEAAWALSNAISSGSDAQIRSLAATPGFLRAFVDLLSVPDVRILSLGLDSISNLLRVGKRDAEVNEVGQNSNVYADELTELNGVEVLEQVQQHERVEIQLEASTILRVSLVEGGS
jgi:importin subunit alpha-1